MLPDTEAVRAFSDGTHDNDDDVEASLHQAQELIGRAMSSRRRDSRQMRHLPGDDVSFDTAAGDMIMRARREVLCVLSVHDMTAGRQTRMIKLLQQAHQRGVDVKTLVPPQVTSTGLATELTRSGQPGYRTRELADQSLLITDGRRAAAPAGPGTATMPARSRATATAAAARFMAGR